MGPGEILKHRDGITINTLMIRAVDAVGMFDPKPARRGQRGLLKTMMSRFQGHSRTAMGFVWLAGGNSRADQVNAGAPMCACSQRPPSWAWACIP